MEREPADGAASLADHASATGADVATLAHLLVQYNVTIERRQGRLWPRPVEGQHPAS
jgi:hypothetical protein